MVIGQNTNYFIAIGQNTTYLIVIGQNIAYLIAIAQTNTRTWWSLAQKELNNYWHLNQFPSRWSFTDTVCSVYNVHM